MSISSNIVIIPDHVLAAKDRLVQQYKESPNINKVLEGIVEPIQVLEDEFYSIYTGIWLDDAIGAQLDGLGKIVGELRLGRSDADYKSAIIAQIGINTSAGEPESILSAIRSLYNPKIIQYSDVYPANYQIYIQSDTFVYNLRMFLRSMTAAGVGDGILTYSKTFPPFVFSEVTNDLFGFDVQSGTAYNQEISQLELDFDGVNIYNLEVNNETTEEDFSGEGFAEVILNKIPFTLNDGSVYDIGDGNNLILSLADATEYYTISEYGGKLVEVL